MKNFEFWLKFHWSLFLTRVRWVKLFPSTGIILQFSNVSLCLEAWRHQAITRTNTSLSFARFYGIHLRAISQQVPELLFKTMHLKIIHGITATSTNGQWVKTILSLLHAQCFGGHIKMYLHILNIAMAQVLEILHCGRQRSVYLR